VTKRADTCPHCYCWVSFVGISIHRVFGWRRWTRCDRCDLYVGSDAAGDVRVTTASPPVGLVGERHAFV
jgi:hypothetical protein